MADLYNSERKTRGDINLLYQAMLFLKKLKQSQQQNEKKHKSKSTPKLISKNEFVNEFLKS